MASYEIVTLIHRLFIVSHFHSSSLLFTGEYLEKIIPLVVKFCNVDDDELREYCIQAFESFVRRYREFKTTKIDYLFKLIFIVHCF